MLDADAATAFDENGDLKSSTLSYVKAGDGVNTVDRVVKTEKSENKLIYVTVEYTNTGTETLTDIMYNGAIRLLETQGDRTKEWRRELEKPAAGDEWDYVAEEGLMLTAEVGAYDVHGGERGNNYHRRPETRRDGYNTRGLCGSRRQTGRDVSKPGQYREYKERAGERLDGWISGSRSRGYSIK